MAFKFEGTIKTKYGHYPFVSILNYTREPRDFSLASMYDSLNLKEHAQLVKDLNTAMNKEGIINVELD